MKIINELYPSLTTPIELYDYADASSVLFFDIETTGLNKQTTSLYLIGCGYYEDNFLHTRFYFADSPEEELDILNGFFSFVSSYKHVVHFNGTKFDLPYLEYKSQKYNITNPLNEINSIDIYKMIKPLRYLLFRESMRQKCVEDFMGIEREDMYNGGELIDVYKRYLINKSDDDFALLMLHNREDVLGMHKLFPIFNYLKLGESDVSFICSILNDYKDINGNPKKELILRYGLSANLPKSFSLPNKGLYFKFNAENNEMIVRMPLATGTMNHYYDNYKDYVYLLDEKRIVHKSIASSIDKSRKTNAKKDSCYVEIPGSFIPSIGMLHPRNCGLDYKGRNDYIALTSDSDDILFASLGSHLLNDLLTSKPKKHKQTNT